MESNKKQLNKITKTLEIRILKLSIFSIEANKHIKQAIYNIFCAKKQLDTLNPIKRVTKYIQVALPGTYV